MRVSVLGSGEVGQRLASGFHAKGHEVVMGTRDPAGGAAAEWAKSHSARARAASYAEAAAWAEVVVLATSWDGTQHALKLANAENMRGKVVIDVTNPLDHSSGAPRLAVGHTDSGGEQVQRWLPDAKVVKAFNIVGNPYMVDPDFAGGPPSMFIAADDADGKEQVVAILRDFGWEVFDIGPLSGARYLEPMAMVWVMHGIVSGGWDHAFKLLRK